MDLHGSSTMSKDSRQKHQSNLPKMDLSTLVSTYLKQILDEWCNTTVTVLVWDRMASSWSKQPLFLRMNSLSCKRLAGTWVCHGVSFPNRIWNDSKWFEIPNESDPGVCKVLLQDFLGTIYSEILRYIYIYISMIINVSILFAYLWVGSCSHAMTGFC